MKTHRNKTNGWLGFSFAPVFGLSVVSVFFPVITGAQTSSPSSIAPAAPVSGYTLTWNDEFNTSAIDSAKWSYRTDSKHLRTQKPENVSVKDGLLRLALKKETAACYGFLRLPTPDLSADFHVFGCEFTAETVKFFLDGVLVETVDATKFPHSDQNVWLSSIASHMGNTPKVDDTALPQEALFDYVRVFTKTNGAAPLK